MDLPNLPEQNKSRARLGKDPLLPLTGNNVLNFISGLERLIISRLHLPDQNYEQVLSWVYAE